MRRLSALFVGSFVLLLVAMATVTARQAQKPAFTPPRALAAMPIPVPPNNPMTAPRIALGKQLFFDQRLSRTKKMSCETCHVPEKGWTDGLALSPRFDGSMNTRHSPTLYSVAYYPDLYWDGRSKGLETQILAAWKGQMGADPEAIATELNAIPSVQGGVRERVQRPRHRTPHRGRPRVLRAYDSRRRHRMGPHQAGSRIAQADRGRPRLHRVLGRCSLHQLPSPAALVRHVVP